MPEIMMNSDMCLTDNTICTMLCVRSVCQI